MNITFGELRNYISRIDRLSICSKDDNLAYENYRFITHVPDKYDKLYVYGIGLIQSEFKIDASTPPSEIIGRELGDDEWLAPCIEIMVSKTPREDIKGIQ